MEGGGANDEDKEDHGDGGKGGGGGEDDSNDDVVMEVVMGRGRRQRHDREEEKSESEPELQNRLLETPMEMHTEHWQAQLHEWKGGLLRSHHRQLIQQSQEPTTTLPAATSITTHLKHTGAHLIGFGGLTLASVARTQKDW